MITNFCHVGFVPAKGYLQELLKTYPNFCDPKYIITDEDRQKMVANVDGISTQLEPLPLQ